MFGDLFQRKSKKTKTVAIPKRRQVKAEKIRVCWKHGNKDCIQYDCICGQYVTVMSTKLESFRDACSKSDVKGKRALIVS